ncbi:wax ester/triacylglycerol synthase family O-acyltransferase [Haloechinothrix salitolerans]|uniref:Diacylglycerol O-acyltransferase n=1 Tax=Haloechinothrix salitolerans TaxID=926830 RepID=A0ABW2BWB8_9PSEU
MQRLTGLDASFLYLETPQQLQHVCALLTLDPSTVPGDHTVDAFVRRLADRCARIPVFRRKLYSTPFNLDHPVWVADEEFDVDNHVFRVELPAPGGREQLDALCAEVAGTPMSRDRPLWEMHVVEGAADGQLAVIAKLHHAGIDGVSGANLISYLASLEPDAPLPEPPPEDIAPPNVTDVIGAGLAGFVRKPVELARLLPELLGLAPSFIARSLRGEGMRLPFTAPRTSFNGTISGDRSVAHVDLPLDDVKRVKNAFGVTVNDVVLAVCSGALRTFLAEYDELPDRPLLATVPVSVRERSQRSDHGSNKVSTWFASLPTQLADPVARLRDLGESNRKAKRHHESIPADLLQDWAQFAAPMTFGLAVRAYSALRLAEKHPVVHNLVISNVPGPPMPLYLLGARITGMYPFGPVFHGAGLNITVVSLAGRVDVGLIAARNQANDLWPLADAIPAALAELVAAAELATDGGSGRD